MPDPQFTTGGADVSDDCVYRYSLWRTWDPPSGSCLFVMLNPSTANANVNDQTISKCVRYTKAWGFGELLVGNLFAYRARNREAMKRYPCPIGPENDAALLRLVARADDTVAAWGADGGHMGRDAAVLAMLRPLADIQCLHVTRSGKPGHPLYLSEDLRYRPLKI